MAKKIITLCLVLITLCLTMSVCTKTCTTCSVFAESNESLGVQDQKSDDYFFINEEFNDINKKDNSARTMNVYVCTTNRDLVYPEEAKYWVTDRCNDCNFGNGKYVSAWTYLESVELKLSVAKYNGVNPLLNLVEFILKCDKNGNWSFDKKILITDSSKEYIPEITLNNLETFGNPFVFDFDKSYYLEYQILSEDLGTNYKISFEYDYYYYENHGPTHFHYHTYRYHIKNSNKILSSQTYSPYKIFKNNLENKYIYNGAFLDTKFIEDYSIDIFNVLSSYENTGYIKNIKFSYLQPIITDLRNDIPFAYKKTVSINVPVIDGRIFIYDIFDVLKSEGHISDTDEENFLQIFNSTIKIGSTLDTIESSEFDGSDYMLNYYQSYILHLKSSSGGAYEFTIGLSSLTDYYSRFCLGSGTTYDILDSNIFEVVWNSIRINYGLSGWTIPDGLTKGKLLTESDIYGYWGFAIIPEGGGINGLLSDYFDSKLNSNGLAFPFYSTVTLNRTQISSIRDDFNYSWLSSTLSNIFNLVEDTKANANYYMFYVAEISNEHIYVISENGSLELLDNSSIIEKKTSNAFKTIGNMLEKVGGKLMNLISNPLYFLILIGIVVIVLCVYFIAKLFKK